MSFSAIMPLHGNIFSPPASKNRTKCAAIHHSSIIIHHFEIPKSTITEHGTRARGTYLLGLIKFQAVFGQLSRYIFIDQEHGFKDLPGFPTGDFAHN